MRVLGTLLVVLLLSMPLGFGQATGGNPSGEIERAREDAMNQRLRGKEVIASEDSLKPGGKNFDFVTIQKKTIEMNHLLQEVNGDVVQASKGVLNKDLSAKLKRLEKLAKEVRQAFE
jgi:hypothetical protein